MKVGIFSPYLDTLGGGERYIFSVAEFFARRGDKVDIYNSKNLNSIQIKERFNLDLSRVSFLNKEKSTFGYDLFFFLSDGSIPFSFARKNILHFQVPFNNNYRTLSNKLKLSRFNHIVCNSNFTKKIIDKSYGIKSEVLYPPVDIESFRPGKKENIILSVGRFFAPSNPKKQDFLISAFKKLDLKDWELVLIGGVFGGESELKKLKGMIGKANIKIIADGSFETLQDYYGKAKIYWHAAGFGEDLENHPEKAEHFGISTVEAMAAGCVPVVFSGGGQVEIVDNCVNGFLWKTEKELLDITTDIIENAKKIKEVYTSVIASSKRYSKGCFYENLEKLI